MLHIVQCGRRKTEDMTCSFNRQDACIQDMTETRNLNRIRKDVVYIHSMCIFAESKNNEDCKQHYFIMQQFRQSPASHLSSGNKFQQQLMSNYLVQHREPSVGHSKKYSKCHPMIVL